ncbi:hypothetical protein L9F63_014979 [Diploptera punctata]|uniref:LRRNT domain-containing protein n=1 Tax=Diploptera punctata TaxID=6984 RepID=A0AAD8EK20_DIPPU|nr:hypothetical protein L9F63_014979 [Diploptera punctata]
MLIILVLAMVFTPSRPLECPTQCRCSNYKTWCKFSRLYKLPSQLPDTTQLLSIHYDDIKILNTSMVTRSGLRNLTHLELNKVQLQQIEPGSFKDMNLLEKLIITNNNISELHADTFKYLNNLHYLKLRGNIVTPLQNRVLSHLVNIRYLYLHDCVIYFPTNISNSVIKSSNCGPIKSPGVLELDDRYNIKNSIDFRTFHHLCSFTHIIISSFSSQHITKDAFLGPSSVTDLQLRHVSFGIVTNVFSGLEKLIKLQFISARLYDIEIGAFENLTLLKYLKLSDNNLIKISSGMFRGLRSLKVLKLDHTHISTLENNGFEGLQSLESLSLDHCRLHSIANDTFIALTYLKELFISSNNMKQIDADAFNGLNQIKTIDLITHYSYNIISFKNNSFSKLKTIGFVNLFGLFKYFQKTYQTV